MQKNKKKSNGSVDNIESIRDTFNEDGYIVLKEFLTKNNSEETATLLTNDWFSFASEYWDRIFQTLH